MKGNGTPKLTRPKNDRAQMARMHQALGLEKGQKPPKYMREAMRDIAKRDKSG